MRRLIYRLRLWWWGPLTTRTTDTMEAWGSPIETEYEVLTSKGRVVGYCAYGHYDPELPYRGDIETAFPRKPCPCAKTTR